MSKSLAEVLKELNLPQHIDISLAAFQGLAEKKPNALYFIRGTSLVYKGSEPYGSRIVRVPELPEPEDALDEIHYFLIDGDNTGIYVVNSERTAFVDITVTRNAVGKKIDEKLTDFIDNIEYDGETAELSFLKPDGTRHVLNFPKDNFLSAASFNAENNVLTLELTDGSRVDVPLQELMNVYSGGETSSAAVEVSEDGEITVDVKLDDDADNAIKEREGGLFVKKTPIATVVSETSTDEEAVSAKAVFEALQEFSWKKVE